jgi:hypothetical protein
LPQKYKLESRGKIIGVLFLHNTRQSFTFALYKTQKMSHDTHNAHSKENKTIISFKNSFWLVIILVGLFIAAINFVQVESAHEGEGHGGGHGTTHGAAEHGEHEAGSAKHEEAAHEAAAPAAEAAKTEAEAAKPAETTAPAGH